MPISNPQCGLCEPATAAIPITVGGIAESDVPSVRPGARADDMARVIARVHEPSPITRVGPGLNDAIKPEFVADAGNVSFEGFSNIRQIRDNPGIAVMSLSHEPTRGLFSFDIGTSLAAPRVARTAAILWNHLRDMFNTDPGPNLVRAVLATAASVPTPLRDCIAPDRGEEGVRQVCGYGVIDEDLALNSASRRLTLVAEGQIRLDTFQVFEVPVPEEFRRASGSKKIIVSLAFDPPVRRRRAEYLGVKMDTCLIRGRSLEQVIEGYRAVSAEERDAAREGRQEITRAFQSPFRCQLDPGPTSLSSSTLQRSEWTFHRESQDYGNSWYLVVRARRTWAPDTITEQDFAVAVSMEANEPQLYNLIRQRIDVRLRARARV